MTASLTAVDLSALPFPNAVELLDFESILAAMLADLVARDQAFTALVESDPAYKVLEVAAYRELLVRQRVNEAIKAVSLANAAGADLDQIGARYNVERLLLQVGDATAIPPVPPTYEDDTSLRRRVQLAFEGFSTAGPSGAYIFHALGADPGVMDAQVNSSTPGAVEVAVLSRDVGGLASDAVLAAVVAALNADETRPMTDSVTVHSAVVTPYVVTATIFAYSGPDSGVVMANVRAAIADYTAKSMLLGRDITLSGIYAALHQDGVQDVQLTQPAASIACAWNQAAYCTSINLTYGGTGG